MRAHEFIIESQLRFDVPNENWLEDKITYAEKKGRDRFGALYLVPQLPIYPMVKM